MNAAVRACVQTSAQRALARVQHAMQSSTGSGVVTVCFVDKLLTELSTLTHPFHTYTIVVPSLLLARRAFVVLSSLFITSKFPTFICCEFLLLALLLRRPSRGHRAVLRRTRGFVSARVSRLLLASVSCCLHCTDFERFVQCSRSCMLLLYCFITLLLV